MDFLETFGKDEVRTKIHKGRRIAIFDQDAAGIQAGERRRRLDYLTPQRFQWFRVIRKYTFQFQQIHIMSQTDSLSSRLRSELFSASSAVQVVSTLAAVVVA